MKKIAAFIFTLGLSASYAMAETNNCYVCEEELTECKMIYGSNSPLCRSNYQACLKTCD